jgi:hypothetical protein
MNINFFEISQLLNQSVEEDQLVIEKKGNAYSYSLVNSSCSMHLVQSTLNCLKEAIGANRLKRICVKSELMLDSQQLNQNTLILTKHVVQKIFIGLLDIQLEDLEEIQAPVSLKEKFQKLVFFKNLEEIEFCCNGFIPHLDQFSIDYAMTAGKGFKGLVERVYIAMHHHFQTLEKKGEKSAELQDIELLASCLSDREIPANSVVHLNEGYFYVDQVIAGEGAYLSILQDIEKIKPTKIVCRGTAIRPRAKSGLKSGLNDILLEIGMKGIKDSWPKLSNYLIKNQIKEVEILGKSLGGAQAQALAVLIEGLHPIEVKKLITYCSVGVGKKINELFKKEVLEKRQTPFSIQVIRNGSAQEENIDYIPAIGGVHLGEGTSSEKCAIEVCYLQQEESEEEVYNKDINFFKLIKNFFCSFSSAHCRQTTLKNFKWKIIEGRDQINDHLRMGERLEKIRKVFAYVVHFLTFFLLNGSSFHSFYQQQFEIGKKHKKM